MSIKMKTTLVGTIFGALLLCAVSSPAEAARLKFFRAVKASLSPRKGSKLNFRERVKTNYKLDKLKREKLRHDQTIRRLEYGVKSLPAKIEQTKEDIKTAWAKHEKNDKGLDRAIAAKRNVEPFGDYEEVRYRKGQAQMSYEFALEAFSKSHGDATALEKKLESLERRLSSTKQFDLPNAKANQVGAGKLIQKLKDALDPAASEARKNARGVKKAAKKRSRD